MSYTLYDRASYTRSPCFSRSESERWPTWDQYPLQQRYPRPRPAAEAARLRSALVIGRGERSRSKLHFKLAGNLSILAVNVLAVNVLAVNSVSQGLSHCFFKTGFVNF